MLPLDLVGWDTPIIRVDYLIIPLQRTDAFLPGIQGNPATQIERDRAASRNPFAIEFAGDVQMISTRNAPLTGRVSDPVIGM
jgi:hypothetical protein